MIISVRCFATLTPFQPKEGEALDLPAGMSVGELVALLGLPAGAASVLFVNGCRVPADTKLKEGDRVGLFPAVGGG
ncbi:MAG: MoaD/ThiS family protein [Bradymonadales bacterium]|nr:MoaD/ThiS family protein [Bradymonadales bacterium]